MKNFIWRLLLGCLLILLPLSADGAIDNSEWLTQTTFNISFNFF